MIIHFNLKHRVLILLVLCSVGLTAQKGVLSGRIFDKSSGEALIGAIIRVNQLGTNITGASTDFDGNYLIELNPGTYDVAINYLSYAGNTITDVIIEPNAVNSLEVSLESESVSLGEVVVKAEAVRSTETALIAIQRKASGIQDGVSARQISRTGSSNAADAVRQLPGAVVEDGKFIVIRGLGDRYSISQLNGITLPGTDPYRNSTSMDLIPAQIIDHIISVKTFTPDLPGNFSGGLINIYTKSIPDKFTLSLTASGSYNTQSSLIKNFKSDAHSGKYDWLGFEDGSRNQPDLLLNPVNRNQLSSSSYLTVRQPGNEEARRIFNESSHQLSNSFFPVNKMSPLNTGLNFALGHRFPVFNKDFGFTVSLNYASTYNHYDDGQVATYINTNTDFLFPYQRLKESKSVFNPSLGGLFNFAYKLTDHHIVSGNIIFNNDAEMISRSQTGDYLGQVSNSLASFNTTSVEFIQRQISNYQLSGKHVFPQLNGIEFEWNASKKNSYQHEPDLRYFAYSSIENEDGEGTREYYINNAEYAFPYHFFRSLQDNGYEAKADFLIPFLNKKNMTNSNSFKAGVFYTSTDREFEEYRYQLNNSGVSADMNFTSFNGDFNAFLHKDNFGIIDTLYNTDGSVQRFVTGYHYINQNNDRNFYVGTSNISAAYAMLTYNLTNKLKAIGGVRMERTDMEVISRDPSVPKGTINQNDLLYSVNLVYTLSENSNLRIAGSKTLARPNLRELAPFVQFDTKNGFFNVGNPSLKRTLIQNYDLRYEIYPGQGELIAISAFYKVFNDPIIRAFNPKATIPELSFINVDRAVVFGTELEFRKELSFITPALKHFYINTNLAYIYSRYKIPADEVANSKNIDPEYNATHRPFQGQAPFIINTALSYINTELGFETALSFNVSGEKLHNISLFATPDVYEKPFSLLNLKISKRFASHYELSVTGKNLLNASYRKSHDFNGKEYIAESYSTGRTFGFSLTYQIK